MSVVHYMHLHKLWYYWQDNSLQKKYYRKIECEEDLQNVTLLSENILSERQAKTLLKEMFPDSKIIKAIPFHRSCSPFGSRPVKKTLAKKSMLKEKVAFIQQVTDGKVQYILQNGLKTERTSNKEHVRK